MSISLCVQVQANLIAEPRKVSALDFAIEPVPSNGSEW